MTSVRVSITFTFDRADDPKIGIDFETDHRPSKAVQRAVRAQKERAMRQENISWLLRNQGPGPKNAIRVSSV